MQDILGYSPLEAGVRFLPSTLMIVGVAPVAGRLADRFGPRWLIAGGLPIVAASLYSFSGIAVDSSYLDLLPGFMLLGIGIAMTMSPMTSAAMNAVAGREGRDRLRRALDVPHGRRQPRRRRHRRDLPGPGRHQASTTALAAAVRRRARAAMTVCAGGRRCSAPRSAPSRSAPRDATASTGSASRRPRPTVNPGRRGARPGAEAARPRRTPERPLAGDPAAALSRAAADADPAAALGGQGRARGGRAGRPRLAGLRRRSWASGGRSCSTRSSGWRAADARAVKQLGISKGQAGEVAVDAALRTRPRRRRPRSTPASSTTACGLPELPARRSAGC